MLDSWASRFAWDSGWTQMIGMETVVRHKNDCSIVARESEKRAKHHVVVAVSSLQAVLENAEVPVVDVILFRRVIPHEGVAEVVNRVVINSHKVPWLALDKRSRG